MQDLNPQGLDCSKFRCEIHQCEIQFLYFGDVPNLRSRLICAQCVIGVVNLDPANPSLVFLKEFITSPGRSIMKITKANGLKTNDFQQIEEMEQSLSQFEDIVNQKVNEIRQNIHSLKIQLFGYIAGDMSQKLKLDDIVQQFQVLSQMDSYQGTNQLFQLEQKLKFISQNLNKIYSAAKENAKDTQSIFFEKFSQNFKSIQKEFDLLSKTNMDRLQNILGLGMPTIIYEDIGQFPEIHKYISQGNQVQYQLLYQGTNDGLNAQTYWQKCNQQSNLLTIMTSKNGNKFGGYSPCLINSALNNYVQDPAMKSFLFQYNKRQIYKLKIESQAVYCHPSYGPTYGGGHDLNIAADFNEGYSNLYSYDRVGHNIIDPVNHMFGEKSPQLQECKVYKVIF